jgi:hypothetical protein
MLCGDCVSRQLIIENGERVGDGAGNTAWGVTPMRGAHGWNVPNAWVSAPRVGQGHHLVVVTKEDDRDFGLSVDPGSRRG